MIKNGITKIALSFALLFAVLFSIRAMSWAQEGICILPTGTAEVTYPPGWGASVLVLYTSDDRVSRGSHVEVWVESDCHGCPPYQWQVSGTGFHFDSISGPTTATTDGDEETLQLWADSTACGSAFITVTDGCQADAEESVREPSYGRWIQMHEEYCATIDSQPGGCDCYDCSEVVVGGYKYRDCWFGGTRAYNRYHGPTCTKWPYTEDLSGSDCGCAGFYYPFGLVGLYHHFMWEWRCN
jgi:hypothetical protein